MKKLSFPLFVWAVQIVFSAHGVLIDRGGGLIYDTDLNITWLQDANYAKTMGYDPDGLMTWRQSVDWVNWLVYQGYSDWRLPVTHPLNGTNWNHNFTYDGSSDQAFNISAPGTTYSGSMANEMAYIFYVTLGNPARYDTNGNDRVAQGLPAGRTNAGPFVNLRSVYWTGTAYPGYPNHAWYFDMNAGEQATGAAYYATPGFLVWAVRPGDSTPLPGVPNTSPILQAHSEGNNIVISWPASATGFFLKSSFSPQPTLVSPGATNLVADDISDMQSFSEKMRQPPDPLSQYLSGQISATVSNMIVSYPRELAPPDPDLQQALASEMTRIIQIGPIYSSQRFSAIPLSPWTQTLLDQNPAGIALVHLNRLLLEDAYPLEIANSIWQRVTNTPVVSADRQLVTVTVAPLGKARFYRLYKQ